MKSCKIAGVLDNKLKIRGNHSYAAWWLNLACCTRWSIIKTATFVKRRGTTAVAEASNSGYVCNCGTSLPCNREPRRFSSVSAPTANVVKLRFVLSVRRELGIATAVYSNCWYGSSIRFCRWSCFIGPGSNRLISISMRFTSCSLTEAASYSPRFRIYSKSCHARGGIIYRPIHAPRYDGDKPMRVPRW